MSTKIDTTIISRNQNLRFVTAASLFDGHDASINIIRRILQSNGCEVIHLGHNRSVEEIVDAAVQEDADGIAVSSYQGGHVEYFKYMIDLLKEKHMTKLSCLAEVVVSSLKVNSMNSIIMELRKYIPRRWG